MGNEAGEGGSGSSGFRLFTIGEQRSIKVRAEQQAAHSSEQIIS
jgi:hypothetical protein